MGAAIVDTGPLVAFLDQTEWYHGWVSQRIVELEAPLLVCEPVLVETMYLLARSFRAQAAFFSLLEKGALKIAFQVEDHVPALRRLHRRYRNVPMSLADACIVRMAEIYEHHSVLTLDSDFAVYRKHERVPLALIHPTLN